MILVKFEGFENWRFALIFTLPRKVKIKGKK
jgi:hypothetical protein